MQRLGSASLLLAAFAPLARAQHIEILLIDGQVIPGVGTVGSSTVQDPIRSARVDSAGNWTVHAETTDPDAFRDEFVMRNGVVLHVEHGPLAQPAGAEVDEFAAFSPAPSGSIAWSMRLHGAANDRALYRDATLVAQNGMTPPGAWGAGSVWSTFEGVQFATDTLMAVTGRVFDPTTPSADDMYCSLWTLDGAGQLLSETVLAREGELMPGQTLALEHIFVGEDEFAANALGRVLYGCDLEATDLPMDMAVYLWNGSANVLIAQEGMPSGVGTTNWGPLWKPKLSLNDAGDWVIKDKLDDLGAVIVKNGAVFRRAGDKLSEIGGFTFMDFGTGPAQLTAAGQVLWVGHWNNGFMDPNEGLFLDGELLAEEGVTTIQGSVLMELEGEPGAYQISPNGRYVIFSGTLANGKDGAFLLDREGTYGSFCFGDGADPVVTTPCPCANSGNPGHGCANSFASSGALLLVGGTTSPDTLQLYVGNLPFGTTSIFLQGDALASTGLVFGDGVRCTAGNLVRLGVKFDNGGPQPVGDDDIAIDGTTTLGPGSGDAPLSVLGGVTGGSEYAYQTYYRNPLPSWCPPATFNISSGALVHW